jgi:hypothetical protein
LAPLLGQRVGQLFLLFVELSLGGGVLELEGDQVIPLRRDLPGGDVAKLRGLVVLGTGGQDRLDEREHLVGVDRDAVHLRDDAADGEELPVRDAGCRRRRGRGGGGLRRGDGRRRTCA